MSDVYHIPFRVNLFLVIDAEYRMSLRPYQKAELIFHPSRGTPNTGAIIVEKDNLRANQAWKIAKNILDEVLKDNPAVDTLVIDSPIRESFGGARATIVKAFEAGDISSLKNKVQMRLGKWILGKRIGRGGQAEVFNLGNDENMVLKLFKVQKRFMGRTFVQKKIERYRREIDSLEKLKGHANIITINEAGEEEDSEYRYYYYVMERAEKTLASLVGERALSITEIFAIYDQILNGVMKIHQYFIHRDLKPQNIYIWEKKDMELEVKIGDYGIAFLPDKDRITFKRERVGPFYYMAPEFEEGIVENIDMRADIYSLGKILYYLLSGGKIFNREKFDEPGWNLGFLRDERFFVFKPFFEKTINPIKSQRFETIEKLIADFSICKKEFGNFPTVIDFAFNEDNVTGDEYPALPYPMLCDWLEVDLAYNLLKMVDKPFFFIREERDGESFSIRCVLFQVLYQEIDKSRFKWWDLTLRFYHYIYPSYSGFLLQKN